MDEETQPTPMPVEEETEETTPEAEGAEQA